MNPRSIKSKAGDPRERAEQLHRLHGTHWIRGAIKDGRAPAMTPHFEAIVRRESWLSWLRGAFSVATAVAAVAAAIEFFA